MPLAMIRLGFLALLVCGAGAVAAQQLPGPRPGEGAQAKPPAAQTPPAAHPQENLRKPLLDELFERLARAKDEEEAGGIAGAIERVFQRSGSDTADLLMNRAQIAVQRGENTIAASVLDKLVVVEPDWAEAWSQRATVRFLAGDRNGAVEDLGQALAREPRHFGALAALGSVLYGMGYEKRALEVYRRALAVRPHQSEVQRMIDKLAPEVDGRDI